MVQNAPLAGDLNVIQRFGDHPALHQSIIVEGVALRGHDGIDLATPNRHTCHWPYRPVTALSRHSRPSTLWPDCQYSNTSGAKVSTPTSARIMVAKGDAGTGRPGDWLFRARRLAPKAHTFISACASQPFALTDGWGGYSDPLPLPDAPDAAAWCHHLDHTLSVEFTRTWTCCVNGSRASITVLDPNPDEMALSYAALPASRDYWAVSSSLIPTSKRVTRRSRSGRRVGPRVSPWHA